jgi:hypothetical protein
MSIQKSIDDAILESNVVPLTTEDSIEATINETLVAPPPSAAAVVVAPAFETPTEEELSSPVQSFIEEPVIPSQPVESCDHYDFHRHRAILDFGPHLFEHLNELNGVNGEYVLHIWETTGARFDYLLPHFPFTSPLICSFRIRFNERWIDRHVECEIFAPTITSLQQAIDLACDLSTSIQSQIYDQGNDPKAEPLENPVDYLAPSSLSHASQAEMRPSPPLPPSSLEPPYSRPINNTSSLSFRPPPPPPTQAPPPPPPPPGCQPRVPVSPNSQPRFSTIANSCYQPQLHRSFAVNSWNNFKPAEPQHPQHSAAPLNQQKTQFVKRSLECEDIQMSDEDQSQIRHSENGRKSGRV